MSKRVKLILAFTSLLVVVIAGISVYAYSQPKTPVKASTAATEQVKPPTRAELLEQTNLERQRAGVAILRQSDVLNKTAQDKASEMIAENYYNHVNPKTGKHGYELVLEKNIGCTFASENMAGWMSGEDGADVIDYLMKSKPHKKAILDPRYDLVGFGVSGDIVVQHFCDLP